MQIQLTAKKWYKFQW